MIDGCASGVDGDTLASHAREGGSSPTDALFRKANHWVRPVEHAYALGLVQKYHYAKGSSNTSVYAHGLFHKDSPAKMLGVALWMPPTKSCGQHWWPDDPQAVLSLSRLVITPDVPKNAATFLLMMSVRLIRKKGDKWRCLITQADTWQGHTGRIYRVAGWTDCGLGKPGDVWVDPATEKMVSRKAGPCTRTRAQMLAMGYEFKGKFPKHRFKLVLPKPPAKPEQRHLFSEMCDE